MKPFLVILSALILAQEDPKPLPRFVYMSMDSGKYDILTMDAAGKNLKNITQDGNAYLYDRVHSPWSPNGKTLAFMRKAKPGGDGTGEIYTIRHDGTGEKRLTDLGLWSAFVQWSPDGKWILFSTGTNKGVWSLYTVDPAGEKSTRVAESHNLGSGGWNRATGRVRYQLGTKLHEVDPDGKNDKAGLDVCDALRSPDGTQWAFSSWDQAKNTYDLMVTAAAKAEPKRINPDDLPVVAGFAWSPDGKRLAFSSYKISEDGKVTGGNGIFVCDPDGKNRVQVSKGPGSEYGPVWSPDGKQIAFSAGGIPVVVDVAGTTRTSLKVGEGIQVPVAWSPDGKRVLLRAMIQNGGRGKCGFDSEPFSQTFVLHLVDPDGKNPEEVTGAPPVWARAALDRKPLRIQVEAGQPVTEEATDAEKSIPSPDGKTILKVKPVGDGSEIFIGDRQVTTLNGSHKQWVSWSPCGRYIIFSAEYPRVDPAVFAQPKGMETKTTGIYVMDADGKNPRRVVDRSGMAPFWQP